MALAPIPSTHGALIIRDTVTPQGREALWATARFMGLHHWGIERFPPQPTSQPCPLFGTKPGWQVVAAPPRPGMAGRVGRQGSSGLPPLALALPPTMEEPEIEYAARGNPQPVLFAPRPAIVSRHPGEFRIRWKLLLDTVLTPQGLSLPKGAKDLPTGWIEYYLAFLEALSTPVGAIGRRPYLAVYWKGQNLGSGQFGFVLESIAVRPTWSAWEHILSAEVDIELAEYLVI